MTLNNITLDAGNIFQLTALHRILLKSKFHYDVHDLYSLFGSQWSNKILDEIIRYYSETGEFDRVKSWENWRLLSKEQLEYKIILEKMEHLQAHIRTNNKILTTEEKLQNINFIVSPYVLEDDLLKEFLEMLSSNPNRGRSNFCVR